MIAPRRDRLREQGATTDPTHDGQVATVAPPQRQQDDADLPRQVSDKCQNGEHKGCGGTVYLREPVAGRRFTVCSCEVCKHPQPSDDSLSRPRYHRRGRSSGG